MSEMNGNQNHSRIHDLGMISDRHTAALISRSGAIEWLCLPRFDSGACFARLLDGDRGGFCRVGPADGGDAVSRHYLDDALVLCSEFESDGSRARLTDFLVAPQLTPYRTLVRILEGLDGEFGYEVDLQVRFDFGEVRPWRRQPSPDVFSLVGGDDGLVVWSDAGLEASGDHDLRAVGSLAAGETVCLAISFVDPVALDEGVPDRISGREDDPQKLLEETAAWWRQAVAQWDVDTPDAGHVRTSAMVLRGLTYEPTGAIVAAPTTSLPEVIGGVRNWDYRYSWIRDSVLSVRALAEVGLTGEARGFRRFIERSSAGNADELQILFGIGGERRNVEIELPGLNGYLGSTPVRVGNGAHSQLQLDAYGQIVEQAWHWLLRGEEPEPDYWPFLRDLIEAAAEHWHLPDCGIWEWRGSPKHFVHSKVLCWGALKQGLDLAEATGAEAPAEHWRAAANKVREAVEREGYDAERGVFVQAFGEPGLDAAVLRLPTVGFLEWTDPRMVSTAEVIAEELDDGGLVRRYSAGDGLEGREGAFLPCTYWLAACFAHQGERQRAREAFERANACANDLGLLPEEYDPARGEMLGNFPQGLTHLSQIEAAVALRDSE